MTPVVRPRDGCASHPAGRVRGSARIPV